MMKQKMVMTIAGAVASFDDWSTANVTNVCLAASCQDSAEVSSLAFGLELVTDSLVHLLFPAGGVPQELGMDLEMRWRPRMLSSHHH